MASAHVVKVGQERTVKAETWGPRNGEPVFLMHGTPGSRLGPRPGLTQLERLGVQLVCVDRPGYGDSDRLPGRSVAHAAADTAAVADFLGLDSFAVLGRSGGGPHALGCAALLADRVRAVAALASFAPRDACGLDWYRGMGKDNIEEFGAAEAGLDALEYLLKPVAEAIRTGAESAAPYNEESLPESDRGITSDPKVSIMLQRGFAEALKHSEAGWLDDDISLTRPWGFDLSEIRTPVLLWHGATDIFAPVDHSRWLASHISGSVLEIDHVHAHMRTIVVATQALTWLLSSN